MWGGAAADGHDHAVAWRSRPITWPHVGGSDLRQPSTRYTGATLSPPTKMASGGALDDSTIPSRALRRPATRPTRHLVRLPRRRPSGGGPGFRFPVDLRSPTPVFRSRRRPRLRDADDIGGTGAGHH